MPTLTNQLQALDDYWVRTIRGIARAERNLSELQPQTTRLDGADEAEVALRDIIRRVSRIRTDLPALCAKVTQFDYPVAGESLVDGDPRIAADRWVNPNVEPGCVSCGQLGALVYSVVEKERSAELCAWCRKFEASEGFRPTANLVLTHDRGDRMSAAMVARELAPLREAKKKLIGKTKSTRKKVKKAA